MVMTILALDVWNYSIMEHGVQFAIASGLLQMQKWLVGQYATAHAAKILMLECDGELIHNFPPG